MLQSSPILRGLIFLLGVLGFVYGHASHDDGTDLYMPHQRRAMASAPRYQVPRSLNTSSSALLKAQELVAAAVAQQSTYNTYRVAHPRRNLYQSRHSAANSASRRDSAEPPLPQLTSDLMAAASLLAEHHARQQQANGTLHRSYNQFRDAPQPLVVSKRDAAVVDEPSFWPTLVDHGVPSMGSDPSYPVYRDVTDPRFGAKGDGVTDDTAAINAAIAYDNNCEENCLSSTVKSTFIYFPPGTYLISSPINAAYYSQLVGNPNNLAIIKTARLFVGLGAIQTDVYVNGSNGAEWYVEQSNFYR